MKLTAKVRARPWIGQPLDKIVSDAGSIVLFDPIGFGAPNSSLGILINPRNHPLLQNNVNELFEELTFHGKIFKDVYYNIPENLDEYQLYYNTKEGFVGIENKSKNISLSFERIE